MAWAWDHPVTGALSDYLYHYSATVVDIYDADTIRVDIDLGFNQKIQAEPIRLFGIDAPEMRGIERPEGIEARDALRELILGKQIILQTLKDTRGKYGRLLGLIWLDDLLVNQWLVDYDYAEIRLY